MGQSPPLSAEQLEFFETHIRPVLVEHCYACHNSTEVAEGDVALDHRLGLQGGDDDEPLVTPGNPARSRLLAILKHEIPGLEMPEDGPKLSDQVISNFQQWIAMGAPDPRDTPASKEELSDATSWEATVRRRTQWWSFQPIVDPIVPAGDGHPIDRFIRHQLDEQGLQPASSADPPTLIRRLYLTLIGLPPTVGEWEQWLARYQQAEDQATVTESLIDALLASDHFGERWARHWMDWIRYAESHGSEGDPAIDNAWLYRDYLIRALNDDVPYNQLIREHVAGDLLANPRVNDQLAINESILATAHWRMVFHGFAPTDALDEKVRFIDDQVNAFSKAFLGLTVSCARCHDHKFDAISQQDYYAMFGVLSACRPGRTAIDLPQALQRNRAQLIALKDEIRSTIGEAWLAELPQIKTHLLQGNFETPKGSAAESLLQPLAGLRDQTTVPRDQADDSVANIWNRLTDAFASSGQALAAESADDSPWIARWDFSDPATADSWSRTGTGLSDQPTAAGAFAVATSGDTALLDIYPAGIYSHLLSDKHAARLTSPDVMLDGETEVWMHVLGSGESTARYAVQDYPRNGTVYPVINLPSQWQWQRFDLSYWKGDRVHFEVVTSKDAPLLVKGPERSWFGVSEVRLQKKGPPAPASSLRHFRGLLQAAKQYGPPQTRDDLAGLYRVAIEEALMRWRDGNASDADAQLLSACLQSGLLPNTLSALGQVAPLIERYRVLESEIPVPTRIPSLEEARDRVQPLYVRGNHRHPGETVPRRFLEVIDDTPYESNQSGRLELAEDLLRDDNPFTRRVIVNRVWHHLFGRGIVATPDNLGRMGEQPTHPELLDWLACRLVDQGWSLKSLIRTMVTSKTWQQSSRPTETATRLDPNNRWLSHANLRRLEAEAIRDAFLAASGKLDRQRYGPPVNGDANRRSIYVRVMRNSLDPFLRVFDFPEPFSATGRRDITNVPAQSLTLLNAPFVSRCAEELATSILAIPTQSESIKTADHKPEEIRLDETRLTQAYLTLFSRKPTQQELRAALDYLQIIRKTDAQNRDRRTRLAKQIDERETWIRELRTLAKDRIEPEAAKHSASTPPPQPIARWEFEDDLSDSLGELHGIAHGDAHVSGGMLVLERGAYVTTPPIRQSVSEKTLEAWVRLDNLDQQGGGVISLQTRNGAVFDSIVFAETEPRRWLAGSDFHRRSQSFQGPAEQDATVHPVHLAITYHADGRITGYRNGVPYGTSYPSSGPIRFEQNDAILSFGLRHLPAGGNRLLAAHIERAAFYDRALSDSEVARSYRAAGTGITEQQLLEAMTTEERARLEQARGQADQWRAELQALGPQREPQEHAVWSEMSRSLFLLKELIYVP